MISPSTIDELRSLPPGRRIGSILKEYDRATERDRIRAKVADLRGETAGDELGNAIAIEMGAAHASS